MPSTKSQNSPVSTRTSLRLRNRRPDTTEPKIHTKIPTTAPTPKTPKTERQRPTFLPLEPPSYSSLPILPSFIRPTPLSDGSLQVELLVRQSTPLASGSNTAVDDEKEQSRRVQPRRTAKSSATSNDSDSSPQPTSQPSSLNCKQCVRRCINCSGSTGGACGPCHNKNLVCSFVGRRSRRPKVAPFQKHLPISSNGQTPSMERADSSSCTQEDVEDDLESFAVDQPPRRDLKRQRTYSSASRMHQPSPNRPKLEHPGPQPERSQAAWLQADLPPAMNQLVDWLQRLHAGVEHMQGVLDQIQLRLSAILPNV